MLINETWVNATEGCKYGESGLYEPYTDNPGKLYKTLQREYGRCISKVYVDLPDNKVQAIGWVFVKRAKYEDCNKTYLQETWVELYDDYPEVEKTYHYHVLKG